MMADTWCDQQQHPQHHQQQMQQQPNSSTNVGEFCFPLTSSSNGQQFQQQSPSTSELQAPSQYGDLKTNNIIHNNANNTCSNMVSNQIMSANINIFSNCFYNSQQHQPHENAGYHEHQQDTSKDLYSQNNVFNGYVYDDVTKYNNYGRWYDNHNLPTPFAPRFWSKYGRHINYAAYRDNSIKVTLENKALIDQFDEHCTEMIITKTGRRMFPSPQISIQGLQANTKYFILFDILPADDNRYKFHHSTWVITGKSEPLPPPLLYVHPESPLTGSQWMKQQINFHKVKLTNNTCNQHSHLILNSMHRYQPRIHVVAGDNVCSIRYEDLNTYAFPECQFIAVTAYQNPNITQLKIDHNPFAKGFRKQSKEKRTSRDSEELNEVAKNKRRSETDGAEKDSKRPYASDSKFNSGPDRKIGYFDLGTNRWNYPDTVFASQSSDLHDNNVHVRNQNMIGSCVNQPKYDYRQQSYFNNNNNNNNNGNSSNEKEHYPNFGQVKYNETQFPTYESRPFTYGVEFSSPEYRAHCPSFI